MTTNSEFEIGVGTTVPLDSDAAWTMITTGEGASLWLSDNAPTEQGQSIMGPDGHHYELHSIEPGEHMRLRRVDPETGESSFVQVTLSPAESGTEINFHHEGLRDDDHREEMRSHWQRVADKILGIV